MNYHDTPSNAPTSARLEPGPAALRTVGAAVVFRRVDVPRGLAMNLSETEARSTRLAGSALDSGRASQYELRRHWPLERLLEGLERGVDDEQRCCLDVIASSVPQAAGIENRRIWAPAELTRAVELLAALFANPATLPLPRALALHAATRLGVADDRLQELVLRAFDDRDACVRIEAIRAFPNDPRQVWTAFGDRIQCAEGDAVTDVAQAAAARLGTL